MLGRLPYELYTITCIGILSNLPMRHQKRYMEKTIVKRIYISTYLHIKLCTVYTAITMRLISIVI